MEALPCCPTSTLYIILQPTMYWLCVLPTVAFVLAELLGWLEVIRQEIVFISGQEDSVLLSALVDAIK